MHLTKTALIDADVLRYEVGSVGQDKDGNIQGFDFVKFVFDERIRTITEGAGCTNSILFLTGDTTTNRLFTRREPDVQRRVYIPNFREALAKGKVYKGTRKQDKPFHWINLTAYILSLENIVLANGCEADDAIGIEYTRNPENSIICTRDKDLRMVPGWHYGWECGKQPEFGPKYYDNLGEINLVQRRNEKGKIVRSKIVGGGFKFFCSQLLTGDVVDNIGGAKGAGPVKAYSLLSDCASEQECFDTIVSYYQGLDSERWRELLDEQCHLLWIIRETNPDGSLKHFNIEERL